MAGYDSYKDLNGVTWFVYTADQGWKMAAGVADDANPYYEPPPADLLSEMGKGGLQIFDKDIIRSDPPTVQQSQNLFLDLRKQIDRYAKEHKADVAIRVTASPGGAGWVVLGLILLALADDRR